MKKRVSNILLFVALFLFIGGTLSSVVQKKFPFKRCYYTLDRHGMYAHPPMFHIRQNGIFFIHPGLNKDAKGVFTFKENGWLYLRFFIQKGSKLGNIRFTVKKNGELYKIFSIDVKHDFVIKTRVKKRDKLSIEANAAGSPAGDWGNLEVKWVEPYYDLKIYLTALLWVIFFYYLAGRGYIYIAISAFFGFILALAAERITFGPLRFSEVSTYTALFFFIAFIFVWLYQELRPLRKLKIATLIKWSGMGAIYLAFTAFILFYLVFGKPIDWNILFAVFQTNFNEAKEFILSFIPMPYLAILAFFALISAVIYWRQESKERAHIERSLLFMIMIVFSAYFLQNLHQAKIIDLVYRTYQNYQAQIQKLIAFQKKRQTEKIPFSATKKEQGELYVVVIGESLNKYNMGIYGHFRDTTPLQAKQVRKENLIVFYNAYANAGNTMLSLSQALTEANQYNGKDYLQSLSFIDIFNKAGFDTYWIANQSIIDGSYTLLSVIAKSSQHIIDLTHNIKVRTGMVTFRDEAAIDELKKLVNSPRNTLVIVHLYGNHFRYQDRYPKTFAKFKETKPYMIGTNNAYFLSEYTAYDNSVYYNDFVVSRLLNTLKTHRGPACFLYFSDHAEDIARHRAHTSRPESFTFGMVQIPLTAWCNESYQKAYPQTYRTLRTHTDKLFSNDLIYDTVIGLAHIQTDRYDAQYDLSAAAYRLAPKQAKTLHGQRPYTSVKNFYYWRLHNTDLLKNTPLFDKAVITCANTVGKLNEAWRLGYRAFALKLKYINPQKGFQPGDKPYDTGGNLIDLLSYFDTAQIRRLFLYLSNLGPDNLSNILARLETVKKRLKLQNKTVLLTDQKALIPRLRRAGWQAFTSTQTPLFLPHALDLGNPHMKEKMEDLTRHPEKQSPWLFVSFPSTFDR